jgi:hypothetical protein
MIGSIYTEMARDAWTTVPGRSIRPVYNADGNPVKLTYIQDGEVVFVKHFEYDADGNVTLILCDTNDD